MDLFSISSSTIQCSHTPPPHSAFILVGKHHHAATNTSLAPSILASSSSHDNALHKSTTNSRDLRRPLTHKPLKTANSSHLPGNPLKKFVDSQNNPSVTNSPSNDTLSNKLWLSSKLSPPPPPPSPPSPPLQETLPENEIDDGVLENSEENEKEVEFREKGKIFVGNLPLWIKKSEVAEFFRQFGPMKNVIIVKGHDDLERNMGFGFVIYSGHTAEKAAMKAVEFDGVEFHGRVLTVQLDNGKRMKGKYAERARWVEGKEEDGEEYRSKWHEEREGSRKELQKVLESQPENWQAVVRAFERIKKVKFGFLIFHDLMMDFWKPSIVAISIYKCSR